VSGEVLSGYKMMVRSSTFGINWEDGGREYITWRSGLVLWVWVMLSILFCSCFSMAFMFDNLTLVIHWTSSTSLGLLRAHYLFRRCVPLNVFFFCGLLECHSTHQSIRRL
jgi:hypothetical protein